MRGQMQCRDLSAGRAATAQTCRRPQSPAIVWWWWAAVLLLLSWQTLDAYWCLQVPFMLMLFAAAGIHSLSEVCRARALVRHCINRRPDRCWRAKYKR